MADFQHIDAIYSEEEEIEIIERLSISTTAEICAPDPVIVRGAGSTTLLVGLSFFIDIV